MYGAGSTGTQLVRSLLGKPGGRYVPVGLLDDNQPAATCGSAGCGC
ncbi:MAG: hypothetical protein R2755_28040 [Acidimicrobiales bacterium]